LGGGLHRAAHTLTRRYDLPAAKRPHSFRRHGLPANSPVATTNVFNDHPGYRPHPFTLNSNHRIGDFGDDLLL
jgi:hypothetical protein